MSYHYRPNNKKEEILRELNQIQNDLNTKNQSFDRLKQLEAEFYEDKGKPTAKDKMSLADEVMNELISAPSQSPYNHKEQPYPQARREEYKPPPSNFVSIQPYQKEVLPNQRENNFINQRQIQKNKLQNQKHEGLFPDSSGNNRVRSYGKQQQQQPQFIPEKDKIEQKLSPYGFNNPPLKKAISPQPEKEYKPDFNPFVRADELQKQKEEQSKKEYRRDLDLQRQQQQRIKEQRQKQKKMMKGQFNDFLPGPKVEQEKPLIMKKADPNSKPPKIQPIMGNYSQFDANLIKSKGIEIKSKYKKGKITYEQCQRQLNNLRKQYNGNFDELLDNNTFINRAEREQQVEIVKEPLKVLRQESPKKQSYVELEKKNEMNNFSYPIRNNQSVNFSQFVPSMLPQQDLQQKSQLSSTLPPHNMMGSFNMPANAPADYTEFVKKMFEVCMKEVKELYSQRFTHQDQTYQQALNKFMQFTQNNLLTQQIPPIQASQQKQFYSDAKQFKEYFDKESNIKKKVPQPISGESLANIPFGESDNSEFYDKSLSGIASKVPFANPSGGIKAKPKAERQEKMLNEYAVQDFYTKRYKIKKLSKFSYLIDANQSQLQIPSTSTYLRTNNALEELERRFNEDLNELKKLSAQKKMNQFSTKVTKNTTYTSQRVVYNDPATNKLVGSANPPSKSPQFRNDSQENPFLKKHISSDDNMMTFNSKQPRAHSPIQNYSPQSKKQILEQDEYQTEPRVKEQANKVPSYIQEYEQRLNMPNKAIDFVRMNNQILSKYEKTQQSKKEFIIIRDSSDLKEKEGASNYFTNNDISPVKKSENYYEESLETIRSDFQSAHHSKRPVKAMDANQMYNQREKSKLSLEGSTPQAAINSGEMIGYSQTVESIEESSAKNSRPPVSKRRTLSRKKESSIVRSKLNQESQLSKGYNNNKSVESLQAPKFDSNVYESQYEESADYARSKITQLYPQIENTRLQKQDRSQPNIEIYVPTVVTPKSALIEVNNSSYEQRSAQSKLLPQNKLKSLEQARKLAKEYRVKANDQSKQFKSVQQRFSELQSFMTKRGDESIHSIKKEATQRHKQKTTKGKKDIMKMLQQLQDNDEQIYQQEFQSYRQESQQYQ